MLFSRDMNRALFLLCTLLSLFSGRFYGQPSGLGNLVIVGGGLEADNKSIYQQLIDFAGGKDKATFAIIPSASGVPVQSYASFRNILISYGLKPENIYLIPVALIDDDSTLAVNESEWKNNGNDSHLAELVRKCSAVWFTGGDQLRTTRTLYNPDGSQTPVLKAVWEVYRSGGVLGGTSAGAAIMSEVMIGGGTSMAALRHGVIRDYQGDDFPESSGLLISKGLGFFPLGVVDQHFNERARIGRLAVALMNEKKGRRLGFGIDENTAIIYHGHQNRISVAGISGVTILNARDARISLVRNLPVIENLLVSYLSEGDSRDCTTGIITPAKGKQSIKEKEHTQDQYTGQTGILSGSPDTFRDLITRQLAGHSPTNSIQNINFIDSTSAFLVTLCKTPESDCFYPEKKDHESGCTVTGIRMDIIPVQVSIKPLKNEY